MLVTLLSSHPRLRPQPHLRPHPRLRTHGPHPAALTQTVEAEEARLLTSRVVSDVLAEWHLADEIVRSAISVAVNDAAPRNLYNGTCRDSKVLRDTATSGKAQVEGDALAARFAQATAAALTPFSSPSPNPRASVTLPQYFLPTWCRRHRTSEHGGRLSNVWRRRLRPS